MNYLSQLTTFLILYKLSDSNFQKSLFISIIIDLYNANFIEYGNSNSNNIYLNKYNFNGSNNLDSRSINSYLFNNKTSNPIRNDINVNNEYTFLNSIHKAIDIPYTLDDSINNPTTDMDITDDINFISTHTSSNTNNNGINSYIITHTSKYNNLNYSKHNTPNIYSDTVNNQPHKTNYSIDTTNTSPNKSNSSIDTTNSTPNKSNSSINSTINHKYDSNNSISTNSTTTAPPTSNNKGIVKTLKKTATTNLKNKYIIDSSIIQIKESDIIKVSKTKNINTKNNLSLSLPKAPLNTYKIPLLIATCNICDTFKGSLKFSHPINNIIINSNKIVIKENYLLADNFMGVSSALFYFEGYLKTNFYTLEPINSSEKIITSTYKDNIIYTPFSICTYLNIGYLLETEHYLLKNLDIDIMNFTCETDQELSKVNCLDKISNSYNNCNMTISLNYNLSIYTKK